MAWFRNVLRIAVSDLFGNDLLIELNLFFTTAGSEFTVSSAVQFRRVSTKNVTTHFRIDYLVRAGKPLSIALRPTVIALIDHMDIREMENDHIYDLGANIMA